MSNSIYTAHLLCEDYVIVLPRLSERNPSKDWRYIAVIVRAPGKRSRKLKYLTFDVLLAKVALDLMGAEEHYSPYKFDTMLEEATSAFERLATTSYIFQKYNAAMGDDALYMDENSEWYQVAGACDNILSLFKFGEV